MPENKEITMAARFNHFADSHPEALGWGTLWVTGLVSFGLYLVSIDSKLSSETTRLGVLNLQYAASQISAYKEELELMEQILETNIKTHLAYLAFSVISGVSGGVMSAHLFNRQG